jgi:hypothetical protein
MPSEGLLKRITIEDVPQKENLIMISLVPKLYKDGYKTSKQIAAHFNQHVRHGSFLIHECRLLGWIDDKGLTQEGERIVTCCDETERSRLIRRAVSRTRVIKCLVKKFGKSITENPDKEKIEAFLYFEVGLAPSTAKRRSSAIVAWLRFLSNSPNQPPGTERDHR